MGFRCFRGILEVWRAFFRVEGRPVRERVISERLREICKRIFYNRREVVSFRVVCKKVSQQHNV